MAKKKTGEPAKMGRPRKVINQETFEGLCAIQCTIAEVCAVLHVDETTLEKWCKETYEGRTFSKVFAEKREIGKVSLRRAGFKLAKTNPSVHIFYAKNHLGMTDKKEVEYNPESLKKAKEILEDVDSVID